MPQLTRNTNWGAISSANANFTTAKNNAAGNSIITSGASVNIGTSLINVTYRIYRGFFCFPTNPIVNTPASATLNVFVTLQDIGTYWVMRATKPSTGVVPVVGDYSAVSFGSSYSNVFTVVAGWNAIPLNDSALLDMNSTSNFMLSIIGDSDNSGTPPTVSAVDSFGGNVNPHYIDYVEAVTGYKYKMFSLSSTTTGKFISVPSLNTRRIIGTPPSFKFFRTPGGNNLNSVGSGCCAFYTVDGTWIAAYSAKPELNIVVGDVVYNDANLLTPFNGQSYYWSFGETGSYNTSTMFQIDSTGIVISLGVGCAF